MAILQMRKLRLRKVGSCWRSLAELGLCPSLSFHQPQFSLITVAARNEEAWMVELGSIFLDGRVGVYLSRKVVFCRKLRNWHRLICQCLPRPLWSPDRIKCLDLHGGKSDPEPKQQPQGDPPSPCATDRPVTSTHDTMHSLTKHNATQTTAGKYNINATLQILACVSLTSLQIATMQRNFHLQSKAPMKNVPVISLGIII